MRRELLGADIALKEVFALNVLRTLRLTVEQKVVTDRGDEDADSNKALLAIDDGQPIVLIAGRDARPKEIVLDRRGDGVGYVAIKVLVPFPLLNDQDWNRVKENGEGEEVVKTIELISFMLDKGPTDFDGQARWSECVEEVRRYLCLGDNIVAFPLVAHVFARDDDVDAGRPATTG